MPHLSEIPLCENDALLVEVALRSHARALDALSQNTKIPEAHRAVMQRDATRAERIANAFTVPSEPVPDQRIDN